MEQHGFAKSLSEKTAQMRYVCPRCKHEEFKREPVDE